MADGRLRALVATASLDLGVDWGDVDLVVQMGAPKGSSRMLQRIGRANHRLDESSKALIVPGNRFEYLEAQAALDAVHEGALDEDRFRSGALDVLAQHVMALACAEPISTEHLHHEIVRAAPYADLTRETLEQVLHFVSDGGYALKAYDRFRRITQGADGRWRVTHPRFVRQHRENAGVIVDAPVLAVRFKNGRKLGTVEEFFASHAPPGRHLLLQRTQPRGREDGRDRPSRPRDHPPGSHPDLCRNAVGALHQPRQPRPPLPARSGAVEALPR